MLELICHHQYTWNGVPADKSPYRNHGSAIATGGGFDGFEPGSGFVTFPHPTSRIRIANGTSWRQLVTLKIEVLVRVDPMATRQSRLVSGHQSFRLGLVDGLLEAQFVNATDTNNRVRNADAFSPDGARHPVPVNKWVKLGFHHDGFAKMRLFIDDELVGEAIVEGSIPAVQSLGVSIGNGVENDGLQFPGEIDEVRIWRLDPKAMKRELLSRPYPKRAALCWQRLSEDVNQWMSENPEQTQALAQLIGRSEAAFLRSLLLLPESEQAKLNAVLAAFLDLWSTGRIAGPEMEKALCHWITLLRALGIDPGGGPMKDAIVAALAEINIKPINVLKCDPQLAGFLELLRKAVENCYPTKEEAVWR